MPSDYISGGFLPFEDSGISDPATGKQIAISISLRKFYRKTYDKAYGHMKNEELNKVIAQEFAKCSSNIIHYFKANTSGEVKADWAEIRKGQWSTRFFISLIGSDRMYVITLQNAYKEPRVRRVDI